MNTPTIPTTITLADGVEVPYEVGTRVFNYYDGEWVTIHKLDTYGQLDHREPSGVAWWPTVITDDGRKLSLDRTRMASTDPKGAA